MHQPDLAVVARPQRHIRGMAFKDRPLTECLTGLQEMGCARGLSVTGNHGYLSLDDQSQDVGTGAGSQDGLTRGKAKGLDMPCLLLPPSTTTSLEICAVRRDVR
jgi:hypothetical protein